ncbi:hypothetical protein FD755_010987 [Muntiacus reevesi]|uniref:Serologically defined colon cancer antigen 8 n=1 Tax=Muntiacus reevesi TaxID=9886 RepID=A0A5N3XT19_MUNRE|nr:hypothetical protein FD755_010987 [Muntiacus reevesi]
MAKKRANRSIHQLKCALRESDVTVGEDMLDPSFNTSVGNEDAGNAWRELQHSHAVNQLKALLRQQATKESGVSPRRQETSSLRSSDCEETNMPTVHNLVPIINDQSQYIYHLEAEVKFCKEELSGMKNRVQVVVLENERLQQELKSRGQEEMREQTLLDESGNMQNSWITTGEDYRVDEGAKRSFSCGNAGTIKVASAGEAEKWKLELERLKLTYEEKSEILESQLTFLRKDLAEYQKNCEDLKERLKHKESLLAANISNRVGGLCLKCAQHEAVLSQTHNNVHIQTIERLTKERDDLMSALVSVRSSLTEVQQREASAYEQVKQAVKMTEEASFEKTKALIQCEQLKNELERQTDRLEKELASQQEKRAFEKETLKKEITKEREDMGSKVCGEMRYQLNKTKMEKDEAEKEHREYRTKTKRDLEIKDQVRFGTNVVPAAIKDITNDFFLKFLKPKYSKTGNAREKISTFFPKFSNIFAFQPNQLSMQIMQRQSGKVLKMKVRMKFSTKSFSRNLIGTLCNYSELKRQFQNKKVVVSHSMDDLEQQLDTYTHSTMGILKYFQPLSSLSPLSPFPSSSLRLHVINLLFSVGPPPAWDTHGRGCRPP